MTLGRVAILGAGRTGCSIYRALLSRVGVAPLLWTRSSGTARAASDEGFPVIAGPSLPDLGDASLVLLTVSDRAVSRLASVLAEARAVPATAVVAHVSGALDLSPLRVLANPVGSMHPLVSIATRQSPLSGVASIAASDARADGALEELASVLGLSVIRPAGDRRLYHAAASVVGNFPQVLLASASRLLLTMGLSPEEARAALGPLLTSASENAARLGPAPGLTGPIVRGDVDVVQGHLVALANVGFQDVESLYRAAGVIAVELARERGAPNTDAIEAVLRDA